MQIGILARDYSNQFGKFGIQDHFFRECCTEAQAAGIELFVFSPDGIHAEENAIDGFRLAQNDWVQHRFAIPPVVYDRSFFYDLRERIAVRLVLRQLKKQFFINPAAIIDLANNKWDCYRFMTQHRIATPQSFKPKSCADILNFVDEQGQAFLKPDWGMKGMDILFIKSESADTYWTELNGIMATLNRENLILRIDQVFKSRARGWKDFLIQKAIDIPKFKERFFDIRVLVQKTATLAWQITGAAARICPHQSRIANLRDGTAVETLENLFQTLNLDFNSIWCQIQKQALDLCAGLEQKVGSFGELGVDFLIDTNNKPWLVEFNAKPGRFIFTRLADCSDLTPARREHFRQVRRQVVLNPFLFAQAWMQNSKIFT